MYCVTLKIEGIMNTDFQNYFSVLTSWVDSSSRLTIDFVKSGNNDCIMIFSSFGLITERELSFLFGFCSLHGLAFFVGTHEEKICFYIYKR